MSHATIPPSVGGLVGATKLDVGDWLAVVAPAAGEAVIVSAPQCRGAGDPRRRERDNDRAAANRAAAALRRYVRHNYLSRHVILTYRVERQTQSVAAVRADLKVYRETLRRKGGGDRFPWAAAIEQHQSGMLHVHLLLPMGISRSLIESCWGHGWTTVKRMRSHRYRRAVAHYLAKDFNASRTQGAHRYEVAQGFQPEVVRARFATAEMALAWARRLMGSEPTATWCAPEGQFPRFVLFWDDN